jgi:hypothetical protein
MNIPQFSNKLIGDASMVRKDEHVPKIKNKTRLNRVLLVHYLISKLVLLASCLAS